MIEVVLVVAVSGASWNAFSASRPLSTSWEVEAQSWYAGATRTQGDGSDAGSFDELSTDLKCVLSLQMSESLMLRFGAEWERFSFGVSDQVVVPPALHKVNAWLGLDYQLTDHWLLRADLHPGVYTDFQDVGWSDVDAPLLIGAGYLVNADLQWFFGVRLDLRSPYPALPAAGVRWRFADAWTLNLLLPDPRLEYDLNDRLKVYLGFGVATGTFRLGDHFGDGRGRTDLDHALLDYWEARVGPGFSWKSRPGITFEAEAGCLAYRAFDFVDEDLTVRSDPAPYARLTCQIRF
ncbi:MAG: DUF6268 family outer membrane beta-barrel protein [Verrucomicrobiia bacterium]